MPSQFDVWVCQGRMCTGRGADEVAARARDGAALAGDRIRVLRGGCYGLCELGPNVVVRQHGEDAAPDADSDRLSLSNAEGETVYCGIAPAQVDLILRAHQDGTAPIAALTREAREAAIPPTSAVAANLRRLRQRRRPSTR